MSDIKEEFRGLLKCNEYADRTINNYYGAIDTLSQFYNRGSHPEYDSLWEVTNPVILKALSVEIKDNNDFKAKNKKGNNMYSNALNLYADFIKYRKFFNSFSMTTPSKSTEALQVILYGAPGTGKSFNIKDYVGTVKKDGKEVIREDNNIRTTFHPDTDYASFVGCYKPMRDDDDPKLIVYKYEPQAFVKAYIKAWQLYLKGIDDNQFYLIIEEINRGNCAQIFGDMFQLLDREDSGKSSYKVTPDSDLQIFLEEAFKDDDFSGVDDGSKLQQGKLMQLPPNLSILATMNTSDQSLFPMDSAFKRLWSWEYVKIDTNLVKDVIFKVGKEKYYWADFVNVINDYIKEKNDSTAKQIGPWFAKPDDDIVDNKPTTISYSNFCSKVLYYLFNDALRDIPDFGNFFLTDDDDDTKTFFFENLYDKDDKGIANVNKFIENLHNDRKWRFAK